MNAVDFDVIVIGGGVVGLSAALAMSQRGYTVAVLDAGELQKPTANSRVYALNHASQVLFENLGVWSLLDQTQLAVYQSMHILDAESNERLDFDARLIAADRLGVMVDDFTLKNALYQRLSTTNVQLIANRSVTDVHFDSQCVNIVGTDVAWVASWMIVADGSQSSMCKLLDIPVHSWPYYQSAITARVSIEGQHGMRAYQIFHADGPLAFLPLASKNECAIVWSSDLEHTKQRMALSTADFNQALNDAACELLGKCSLISVRQVHPLVMRHASKYAGDRWVLMGDVAHTIHPLAGLGLNLGLADLTTWLGLLPKDKTLHLSRVMLGKYQRQRKYMVWQIILCMEMLKRLFSTAAQPVVFSRKIGVKVCQNVLFLKKFFIEQAGG